MDDSSAAGTPSDRAERVHRLMPQLTAELSDLVAIPSVSEVGYPEPTRGELLRAHEMISGASWADLECG